MSGHHLEITIGGKFGVATKLVCDYDKADTKRPCWPHTENGEPYALEDGIKDGCVYWDWWDMMIAGRERTIRVGRRRLRFRHRRGAFGEGER